MDGQSPLRQDAPLHDIQKFEPVYAETKTLDRRASVAQSSSSFHIFVYATLFALSSAAPAWAAPTDQLWSHWTTYDAKSTVSVDHQPWQRLLSRYVVASDDGINRVAYRAFDDSSKILLSQYLKTLSNLQPTQLNQAQQLAYWINLYNALTVQVILDHPKKSSIRSMGPLLSFGPWDKAYLIIEGKPVSLDDIEHRILRPIWQDHRLHFVLNCASIGCPNLSQNAYTAKIRGQCLSKPSKPFSASARDFL